MFAASLHTEEEAIQKTFYCLKIWCFIPFKHAQEGDMKTALVCIIKVITSFIYKYMYTEQIAFVDYLIKATNYVNQVPCVLIKTSAHLFTCVCSLLCVVPHTALHAASPLHNTTHHHVPFQSPAIF